jgi:ATP-dependent Clp protease protease subunit
MSPDPNQYFDRLLLSRRIYLFEELKPPAAREIVEDLLLLDDLARETGDNRSVSLLINSPGGNVWNALAIIETMSAITIPVHTLALGHVGSSGTLIFLAGAPRLLLPRSTLMLHEMEWAHPSPSRVDQALATIRGVDEAYRIIVAFVSERTGLPQRRVRRLLRQETWWTAEQAVADGLADRIVSTLPLLPPRQPDRNARPEKVLSPSLTNGR